MGSTIGRRRTFLNDVIWIDPLGITLGDLRKLALGRVPSPLVALGVLNLVYLKLKLTLRICGFDADFFPFDWRYGLRELGERLAKHVEGEEGPVHLVAHSMGGLVVRAAIKSSSATMKKVRRLVMLGTPNHGSFMPVQALRGTHDLVRKVAVFDLSADAEQFASRVLHTLPGLHQMLPAPAAWSGIDLYDAEAWPKTGLRPPQGILDDARVSQSHLAAADDRFFLIAGVNQPTVTNVRSRPEARSSATIPRKKATAPCRSRSPNWREPRPSTSRNRTAASRSMAPSVAR
jgi:pimeloyl-ACP methyl ester carboxylesterase